MWVEGDKQSGSERGKESDEEQEDAKDKLEDTAVDGSRILARCCLTKNPIYSSHHINVGKITPAEFMASKLPERQN